MSFKQGPERKLVERENERSEEEEELMAEVKEEVKG